MTSEYSAKQVVWKCVKYQEDEMREKAQRRLLRICSMFLLCIMLITCGGCNAADESTKREVDGVIFENDLISIKGVPVDEYVDVFNTQEIVLTYIAKDITEGLDAHIIPIGDTTAILVIPGKLYYDQLPCAELSIFEDDEATVITDILEEFYICVDADGKYVIYYETYHEYDEKEGWFQTTKYVTLKAYKIEFDQYVPDFDAIIEQI